MVDQKRRRRRMRQRPSRLSCAIPVSIIAVLHIRCVLPWTNVAPFHRRRPISAQRRSSSDVLILRPPWDDGAMHGRIAGKSGAIIGPLSAAIYDEDGNYESDVAAGSDENAEVVGESNSDEESIMEIADALTSPPSFGSRDDTTDDSVKDEDNGGAVSNFMERATEAWSVGAPKPKTMTPPLSKGTKMTTPPPQSKGMVPNMVGNMKGMPMPSKIMPAPDKMKGSLPKIQVPTNKMMNKVGMISKSKLTGAGARESFLSKKGSGSFLSQMSKGGGAMPKAPLPNAPLKGSVEQGGLKGMPAGVGANAFPKAPSKASPMGPPKSLTGPPTKGVLKGSIMAKVGAVVKSPTPTKSKGVLYPKFPLKSEGESDDISLPDAPMQMTTKKGPIAGLKIKGGIVPPPQPKVGVGVSSKGGLPFTNPFKTSPNESMEKNSSGNSFLTGKLGGAFKAKQQTGLPTKGGVEKTRSGGGSGFLAGLSKSLPKMDNVGGGTKASSVDNVDEGASAEGGNDKAVGVDGPQLGSEAPSKTMPPLEGITEGLTAEEAESVRTARLAGESVSSTDAMAAGVTEGQTAEQAMEARRAREVEAARLAEDRRAEGSAIEEALEDVVAEEAKLVSSETNTRERYLHLSAEAYQKYYSTDSSLSKEEYMNMALDVWVGAQKADTNEAPPGGDADSMVAKGTLSLDNGDAGAMSADDGKDIEGIAENNPLDFFSKLINRLNPPNVKDKVSSETSRGIGTLKSTLKGSTNEAGRVAALDALKSKQSSFNVGDLKGKEVGVSPPKLSGSPKGKQMVVGSGVGSGLPFGNPFKGSPLKKGIESGAFKAKTPSFPVKGMEKKGGFLAGLNKSPKMDKAEGSAEASTDDVTTEEAKLPSETSMDGKTGSDKKDAANSSETLSGGAGALLKGSDEAASKMPPLKGITEGLTPEEAEEIRTARLKGESVSQAEVAQTRVTEGQTADEALEARRAREEEATRLLQARLVEEIKAEVDASVEEKKEEVAAKGGTLPPPPPLKSTLNILKSSSVGGVGKGIPFMKKSTTSEDRPGEKMFKSPLKGEIGSDKADELNSGTSKSSPGFPSPLKSPPGSVGGPTKMSPEPLKGAAKKGVAFGALKSKGGLPPPPFKSVMDTKTAGVGVRKEMPFMKKSGFDKGLSMGALKSPLKSGFGSQMSDEEEISETSAPSQGGPLQLKSPLKSVAPGPMSKGDSSTQPIPLKSTGFAGPTSPIMGQKKTLESISKGSSGPPFGDTKAKGGSTTLSPPPPLKTTLSEKSSVGVGKGMPFMKKSAGVGEGSPFTKKMVVSEEGPKTEASPLKGSAFAGAKSPMGAPPKKSLESLSKGAANLEGPKIGGSFGGLKSKSSTLPPPLPMKAFGEKQSAGAGAKTGMPFMKKSTSFEGPGMGALKSPLKGEIGSQPSDGDEISDDTEPLDKDASLASPSNLKAPLKSSGFDGPTSPIMVGQKKTLESISKGSSGPLFGDTKAKGSTSLPPPPPFKTTLTEKSTVGVGKGMPFMKKLAGVGEGSPFTKKMVSSVVGPKTEASPLKGSAFAGAKSPIGAPPKKSLESFSKGAANFEGPKIGGAFGGLKSKSGSGTLPPPPLPMKAFGEKQSAGVGAKTGMPFMKKSTSFDTGPGMGALKSPLKGEIGSQSNNEDLGEAEKLGQDFLSELQSPLKSVASGPLTKGDSSTPPIPNLKAPLKGEGGPFMGGQTKSIESMSKGMKGPTFGGDLKAEGGTLPPPPPLKTTLNDISSVGVGKGLPFMKKSVSLGPPKEGSGINTFKSPLKGENGLPDADNLKAGASKPSPGFPSPLKSPLGNVSGPMKLSVEPLKGAAKGGIAFGALKSESGMPSPPFKTVMDKQSGGLGAKTGLPFTKKSTVFDKGSGVGGLKSPLKGKVGSQTSDDLEISDDTEPLGKDASLASSPNLKATWKSSGFAGPTSPIMGQKKTLESMSKGSSGPSFGGLNAKGDTMSPPPPLKTTLSEKSSIGVGKGMPFMKKSAGVGEGSSPFTKKMVSSGERPEAKTLPTPLSKYTLKGSAFAGAKSTMGAPPKKSLESMSKGAANLEGPKIGGGSFGGLKSKGGAFPPPLKTPQDDSGVGKGMPFMKKSTSFEGPGMGGLKSSLKGEISSQVTSDDEGAAETSAPSKGFPSPLKSPSAGLSAPFLKAPLKGKGGPFMGGPTKSIESMSKGSKGLPFGELKAKGGSLPSPPPVKTALNLKSSSVVVGKGMPFMKKSTTSEDGPAVKMFKSPLKGKMGSLNVDELEAGTSKSSPGGFPTPPKSPLGSEDSSAKMPAVPLKGAANLEVLKKGAAFGGLKAKSGALPPLNTLQSKQTAGAGVGGGKGMPLIMKKSAGFDKGPSMGSLKSPLKGEIVSSELTDTTSGTSDKADGVISDDEEATVTDFEEAKAVEGMDIELSDRDEGVDMPTLERVGIDNKQIGTGASFAPKPFTPPEARAPKPKGVEIVDVEINADGESIIEIKDSDQISPEKEERKDSPRQKPQPTKLWSGESFYGTSSSRVYTKPTNSLGIKEKAANDDAKSISTDKIADEKRGVTVDNATGNEIADTKENDAKVVEEQKRTEEDSQAKEKKRLEEERRLVEEKAKAAAILLDKTEEERRLAKAELANEARLLEKRFADEMRLAKRELKEEVQQMEVERARARAKEEERRIKEQNLLVQKRLEKRLAEERAKADAEISELKQKLKEEQTQMEAERLRARAEDEARRIEKQNSIVEERLQKRLAEEKAKLEEDKERVGSESAKEEAEQMENLNRLVEERLQLRLTELKEAQDGQVTASTTKPSKIDVPVSANDLLPQRSIDINAESEKAASIPPSELLTISEPALMKDNVTDALAADVEALELVSMCQAEFDPKSPIYNALATSRRGKGEEMCLLPTEYPFVSLLRDSSPYILNHRHSTIVYHLPGDLISDTERINRIIDDIALTWLFGMKIAICIGCRKQLVQRLERMHSESDDFGSSKLGVRITTSETLRLLEEEAGFCRFEVERLLNRCLRNRGADCNVVSGCFITAKHFGVIDGVDYQHTGYPTTLQTDRIQRFHSRNDVVLLTPLGFTKDGDALNIHSEALAAFTAGALDASKLVYFSTSPMVLQGSTDAGSNQRLMMIQRSNARQILSHYGLTVDTKTGFPLWTNAAGSSDDISPDQQAMLLKMGWATNAIERGVERAHIIDCEDGALLEELFTARRGYGTCISQDGYEAPHPKDWNDDFSVVDEVGAGVMER